MFPCEDGGQGKAVRHPEGRGAVRRGEFESGLVLPWKFFQQHGGWEYKLCPGVTDPSLCSGDCVISDGVQMPDRGSQGVLREACQGFSVPPPIQTDQVQARFCLWWGLEQVSGLPRLLFLLSKGLLCIPTAYGS